LINSTLSPSKLPLAYFTTGQVVPEDLEEAKKERVMDCLLNFSGQFHQEHDWSDSELPLWEKIA
jgi:flagellar biosynthesis GTPase FlhF